MATFSGVRHLNLLVLSGWVSLGCPPLLRLQRAMDRQWCLCQRRHAHSSVGGWTRKPRLVREAHPAPLAGSVSWSAQSRAKVPTLCHRSHNHQLHSAPKADYGDTWNRCTRGKLHSWNRNPRSAPWWCSHSGSRSGRDEAEKSSFPSWQDPASLRLAKKYWIDPLGTEAVSASIQSTTRKSEALLPIVGPISWRQRRRAGRNRDR